MNNLQIIYLVVIFVAVFLFVFMMTLKFNPDPLRSKLKDLYQIEKNVAKADASLMQSGWVRRIISLTGPLSELSLPKEGWEKSILRVRFLNAGLHNEIAPQLFFLIKTLLTFLLPSLFASYVAITSTEININTYLLLVLVLAAIGYFMPNIYLARRISSRKREIFESFPDAMDLIIVCVESGLGLDSALAKVGQEIYKRSPILGAELHLLNLELRAGSSRERALKNLAIRTGVDDIDALVAMLVQSDRFGTSVADSLRVHADTLRTKRRLRAEEAAAKIAVKLLIPLIFCIFPALLVVLLGPAVVSIKHTLMPMMSG
jgi:tight adherence protein C